MYRTASRTGLWPPSRVRHGKPFYAPRTFVSWQGYKLNVRAPSQRDEEGRYWVFRAWSDRKPGSHTITTPANPAYYEATFERSRR